jgi:hypothetical protein
MLPTKFRFIWTSGFRGEEFLKSANQKQESLWRPWFICIQIFKNLFLWNRLAKWTKTWKEASTKGPLWRLHISSRSVNKHCRHPSIDAFYQIAVHFGLSGFKGVEFLKIDQSETSIACGGHLGRKHLRKVLYEDCIFHPDPLTNIAATGNSCFWLVDFFKSSPLKQCDQMNRNLVGRI